MINRCYDTTYPSYPRYGGKGVKVCDKWLCYEYFLEDVVDLPGYYEWLNNKGKYHFDKDFSQYGGENKIYSKETCQFIKASDNIVLARKESNMKNGKKYIGVRQTGSDCYNAYICVNRTYINLGTYNTEELAAAAYNNACDYFYQGRLIKNDVPYINPYELIKFNKHPRYICEKI